MCFFISLSLKLCVIGSLSNIFLTFSPFFIQLVFTVFNGEAWGYLGSRKFLQELDEGAASVNGISSLMIDQVSARQVNTGSGRLRLLLIIFIFQIYIKVLFSALFLVLRHDICFLQSLCLPIVMNIFFGFLLTALNHKRCTYLFEYCSQPHMLSELSLWTYLGTGDWFCWQGYT